MPVIEKYPTSTTVIGPATVYTADLGGDATHTVDAALVQANDYWNGLYIKYLTGDNAGLERLITDFVDLTDTLEHDAFPNTCDAGDTYLLGGWVNPTDAYTFNNTFAYSETDTAEQEYAYSNFLTGNEIIDKVFVRIKWKSTITGVNTGDTAAGTCSIKVYDGSTWATYQVTAQDYAVSTISDESLVISEGDNTNTSALIDVTSHIGSLAELNSAKTRLLFVATEDAGLTLRWSVDAVSILVCYHIVGGVYASRAVTKQDNPRSREALNAVKKFLET